MFDLIMTLKIDGSSSNLIRSFRALITIISPNLELFGEYLPCQTMQKHVMSQHKKFPSGYLSQGRTKVNALWGHSAIWEAVLDKLEIPSISALELEKLTSKVLTFRGSCDLDLWPNVINFFRIPSPGLRARSDMLETSQLALPLGVVGDLRDVRQICT